MTLSPSQPAIDPVSIPAVPFEGRMSYCLMRSIQMVLAHHGDSYPVDWLEVVSGEPFGFVYVRGGHDLFVVLGYPYHLAGGHLLRTLGYDYTFSSAGNDDASALATLDAALREGPVVAGMLDMGYLTYAPGHEVALGADHAIVVLARTPDAVIVHDPAGYPAVPLPTADFLEAWKRDVYTGTPYGLWRIGARRATPSTEVIWEATLTRIREIHTHSPEDIGDGVIVHYGPAAMRLLAADLRAEPGRDLGALPYFSWRVSGQRCFDGAAFLRERLPAAAAIRWEQCLLYGELQQVSASADHARLPELLDRLVDLEERFIAAVG